LCSFIASIRKSNKSLSQVDGVTWYLLISSPGRGLKEKKCKGSLKRSWRPTKHLQLGIPKNSQMCKFRGILTYISCMAYGLCKGMYPKQPHKVQYRHFKVPETFGDEFLLQVLLSSERLQSTSSSSTGRLSASPKAGGGTGSTLSVQQMHLCRDWRCITFPRFLW